MPSEGGCLEVEELFVMANADTCPANPVHLMMVVFFCSTDLDHVIKLIFLTTVVS